MKLMRKKVFPIRRLKTINCRSLRYFVRMSLPSLVACSRYIKPLWLIDTAFWPCNRALLSTERLNGLVVPVPSSMDRDVAALSAALERKSVEEFRVACMDGVR